MAERKVSTTVYLTKDQDARLKALSRRTKVPAAEYVRVGIEMVLKREGEPMGIDWLSS